MGFTKGDWHVQDRQLPSPSSGIWVETKEPVVIPGSSKEAVVDIGVALVFGDTEAERNDNARLMAHSKEMLQAIEVTYTTLCQADTIPPIVIKSLRSILKDMIQKVK